MTEDAAELNYTEAESLIPGRIVEDAPEDWVGGDVELQLLDVSKDTLVLVKVTKMKGMTLKTTSVS